MKVETAQLRLPFAELRSEETFEVPGKRAKKSRVNRLDPQDRAFHDWYRFVLSFPPHLVRDYIDKFQLDETATILDPFCGTGTTLVESKLNGIPAVGVEANPFAHFASSVKIDWSLDPAVLTKRAYEIADVALSHLQRQGIDDNVPFRGEIESLPLRKLESEAAKLLLTNSISPIPLHKTLILLECLREHCHEPFYKHGLLALAKALVFTISNLRFGPEVGVGKIKADVPVISSWLSQVATVTSDLRRVVGKPYPHCKVLFGDAREVTSVIEPGSIDAVITSPPYPNEKDYTRTTRLESVILGFISSRKELRECKKSLVRSNTRGVYKGDDDDQWVAQHEDIERIADEIEKRRVELGKTSGFEKLYGTVTKLYFGGMARHLAGLRRVLRPGARLAYVVGDQASYLRIMIRTGKLLAEMAQSLGYDVMATELFRTRFATGTGEQLREEVVVLRWPGKRVD